ncbi:MAG: DUF1887 family CARF protein [Tannerellaceae bacterium]|nr:DUF1887 family CARF protein [Tannerellaceae bacterium]
MKHQVILLGKDITSSYQGIKEWKPDHVHLLFTNETKAVAEPLFPLLPDTMKCTCYLVKPYEAQSVIDVCREIQEGNSGEFHYNLSEGTKVMAFAAYAVVQQYNAIAFYVTQKNTLMYLNDFSERRLRGVLTNKEILQLHGNILLSYANLDDLPGDDIEASARIKQFIEQYPREHSRLQSFYNNHCQRRLELLPRSNSFSNGLEYVQEAGTLLVTLKDEVILQLLLSSGCLLYFDGRWWETLVANQVQQWRMQQSCIPEVWQSVLFHVNEHNTHIKNEIDILINNGQKLIFIECKSGTVTQNDVYKVDSIREIYGGDISKAILASYYPVKEDLLDKADSLQITCFAPGYFAERIHFIETLPEWLDHLVRELQL